MTEKQLTAKLEKYIKAQARANQIKKELELLQAQISEGMNERNTDILELNGMTAKRSESLTHRFDSKAFKEDNPELYESYYVEATRKNFSVKAK